MECILYPDQYNLILKISFLSLGSSVYAVYNGNYDFAICSGGVFLTSVNYWRKPDYSWRRNVDMTWVKFALVYQLYSAYRSEYMAHYYTLMFFAMCCYPLGIYYYRKKQYWHSTYAHCALHFISNIANLVLYLRRTRI
jgi:hypothetical protein